MNWESIKNWMVENIRSITIGVSAVLIVLAALAGYMKFQEYREQKAVEALYQAREKVDTMPADQKKSDGVNALKSVSDSYRGTRAAYEALIAIADIHSDSKNYVEAIQYYEQAVKNAPDEFAKSLSIYNKATAEEFAGNQKAAIDTYASIEKIKSAKFLLPEILLAQARCYELLKEFVKATEIYQKIQNEFPQNTYYSNAAQAYIEKLKAQVKN